MTGIAERHTTAITSRQRTSLRNHLAGDREQTRLQIERLTEEMGAFLSARRDSPTDDEHDPEGPTLAFERSQSQALLEQSHTHLKEIDAALARMELGRYGICVNCGGEIALGRLQARPQAALCIGCAGRLR
ncbi:MAG TPA: TraR/DksA C4-type zinc finger protein [Glaciihabitans sp.]|nr:TraR/DksA C4-type zinc finger protein [Glaciihabitans sp.]